MMGQLSIRELRELRFTAAQVQSSPSADVAEW
jgi:hypothetical protein